MPSTADLHLLSRPQSPLQLERLSAPWKLSATTSDDSRTRWPLYIRRSQEGGGFDCVAELWPASLLCSLPRGRQHLRSRPDKVLDGHSDRSRNAIDHTRNVPSLHGYGLRCGVPPDSGLSSPETWQRRSNCRAAMKRRDSCRG